MNAQEKERNQNPDVANVAIGAIVIAVVVGYFLLWPPLERFLYSIGEGAVTRQEVPSATAAELAQSERRSELLRLLSEGDRLVKEAEVLQKTAARIPLDGAHEVEIREITRLLSKNTAELEQVTKQIEQLSR